MSVSFGDIPGWIEALSTLLLGVVAGTFSWHQWRASGFVPRVEAGMASNQRRMSVYVTNKGRTAGTIMNVSLHEKDMVESIPYEVIGDGKAFPQVLGAGSAMLIILESKKEKFPNGTCVELSTFPKSVGSICPDVDSNLDLGGAQSIFPPTG